MSPTNNQRQNALYGAQKVLNTVAGMFETIGKGVRAASAAQLKPYDKEAIQRILNEK